MLMQINNRVVDFPVCYKICFGVTDWGWSDTVREMTFDLGLYMEWSVYALILS